jgi:ABC-type multidrug transport system ATPase subunit
MLPFVNTIELKNLQVEINQKMLLKGIDIQLSSSDCCLIIGKNGAGKSTLLNAIIDYIPILKEGQILINNYDLKNEQDALKYKKMIGYSKGDNFLIEDFTVEGNLFFLAKVYDIHKETFTNQINMFSEYFPNIRSLYNQKISKLSTGEYKLICLLTSLLHNPEILIWDEPYSGIDILSSEKMTMMISQLLLEGKIILISSHEENVLNTVGTHVLIIRNGFQSFFGQKNALIERSKDFKNGIFRYL